MSLFLLSYVLIYLLMHGYALYHVYRSFQWGRRSIAFAALFSVFMVLCPVIVRVAENKGLEAIPRLLAYAGYTWMGVLFLFVVVAAVFDVVAVGKWWMLKLRGQKTHMNVQYRRQRFVAQLAIVLVVYVYGLYEANQIRTVNITISSPKISIKMGKLRIAQISDVHLGLIVRERRLERILEKVREAKPDLLVSTGDLVDGQLNDLTGVVQQIAKLKPPYGKLAVTGNHEFYAGLPEALAFTNQAGFVVLRNDAINVNGVAFVGVDDLASERFDKVDGPEEAVLLRRQKPNTFTVLLKHRPVVDPASVGRFDLQLSGHTHKGQIFPFNLLTWLAFGYQSGTNKLEYGYLYVSNGSGTWGPPIRFGAPPEVTIIDLIPVGN